MTNSQEQYLKTIYSLQRQNNKIRVTDIAKKLNYTKPSVNKAIKNLSEIGLIQYKAYGDIILTDTAVEIAKDILRKQDMLTVFLNEIIGVSEIQASIDAENMKFAVSEETEQKLAKYLNKVLDLENLNCSYDVNSEKCKNCAKVSVRDRLKKEVGY